MGLIDRHACNEYNALTRRRFLAFTGATLTAPAWLPRVALARDHRSTQRDVIIQIYLRGAADALSLVPPHADQGYYDARPTISVPRPGTAGASSAIDLDGFFGFSPLLAGLMPAFQDDKLLVVHACGSHDPSRSHFEAQRFMEVGTPGESVLTSGWLGRHLQTVAPATQGALLRAVGVATGLQQTLIGAPLSLPITNFDLYGLGGGAGSRAARRAAIEMMYESGGPPLDQVADTTFATIDLLDTINFAGYAPAGGASYPTSGFGNAMKSIAALIKAQIGVEAIAVDLNGWDTHENQGTQAGTLANLMTDLSNSLGAFYTDMTTGVAPSFVVVVMSEFGRRLRENGSLGTDHGHGGAMFVVGSCVAGGRVLSQWPGLDTDQLFQQRDLEVTIDYRDVLAPIIQNRLGNTSLDQVFPGHAVTPLEILSC